MLSFFFSLGLWVDSLRLPFPVRPLHPPYPWIFQRCIPSRQQPPTHPAFFQKHGCPWQWAKTSCRCQSHVKTAATGRCTAFFTRRCQRPSSGLSRSCVCRTPFSGRSTRGENEIILLFEACPYCSRYHLFSNLKSWIISNNQNQCTQKHGNTGNVFTAVRKINVVSYVCLRFF